jgi:hypothetical protein
VILVKLHQFDAQDRHQMRVATDAVPADPTRARDGVEVHPLYAAAGEDVRLEAWAPGAAIAYDPRGGIEVFVLAGGFEEAGARFARWDWLRLPAGAPLTAVSGPEGARVWIKEGHLARALEATVAEPATVQGT